MRTRTIIAIAIPLLALASACDDDTKPATAPTDKEIAASADSGVEDNEAAEQEQAVLAPLPDGHPDDVVIDLTLKAPRRFWNRAKFSHGPKIRPKPPTHTVDTVLLEEPVAREVIQEAANHGLAQWCSIQTHDERKLTLDALRGRDLDEYEVAYARTLFDTSRGVMYGFARRELGDCTPERAKEVSARIEKLSAKHTELANAFRAQPSAE